MLLLHQRLHPAAPTRPTHTTNSPLPGLSWEDEQVQITDSFAQVRAGASYTWAIARTMP